MTTPGARRAPLAIGASVAIFGAIAAVHYHRLGLTLAHYDARAHLVVSRRVLDSLTPGWQQVGAVWLPLPHLLNFLIVQNDSMYRTGASAVAISILSMALASWSIALLIQRVTGSVAGGIVASAVLMLNPDVLYLQSTPMSEPLLFGTTFLAVALIADWASRVEGQRPRVEARPSTIEHRPSTLAAGWASVAAVLSRYEAWPIVAAAILLAFGVLLRRGWRAREAFRAVRGLALWPLWAMAAFLVNSKVSVGAWFVSSGFFVPDNPARGHAWLAWSQVQDGLILLCGSVLPWIACAGAVLIVVTAARDRRRAGALLTLAIAACAALPWSAYYEGHPMRLRYDVPLVAAAAAIVGMAIALLPRRVRGAVAAVVVVVAVWQASPFDRNAPVIREAQRDAANGVGRGAVTIYLRQHWDGSPIMTSMGSLGHYIHDLSLAGFDVRDFLHEGNGEIWTYALGHPYPFAEWMLVEESARGGDVLYWQGRLDPRFFAGYQRVAEGGGVVLYRRQ
jgi:hypothetical protein